MLAGNTPEQEVQVVRDKLHVLGFDARTELLWFLVKAFLSLQLVTAKITYNKITNNVLSTNIVTPNTFQVITPLSHWVSLLWLSMIAVPSLPYTL